MRHLCLFLIADLYTLYCCLDFVCIILPLYVITDFIYLIRTLNTPPLLQFMMLNVFFMGQMSLSVYAYSVLDLIFQIAQLQDDRIFLLYSLKF